MQIKRDDIDKIKASLSITAVANALGIDVQRGKFRCLYPMRHAHGDRTPSVSISEEKGLFTCWVCEDMRGDVFELVKQARSCSFAEALEWLQTEFMSQTQIHGLTSLNKSITEPSIARPVKQAKPEIKPEERMKVVLSFLKRLSVVDGTPAARWLASRRIFKPAWDKMRLRYISDYSALNKSLLSEFGLELLQKTTYLKISNTPFLQQIIQIQTTNTQPYTNIDFYNFYNDAFWVIVILLCGGMSMYVFRTKSVGYYSIIRFYNLYCIPLVIVFVLFGEARILRLIGVI